MGIPCLISRSSTNTVEAPQGLTRLLKPLQDPLVGLSESDSYGKDGPAMQESVPVREVGIGRVLWIKSAPSILFRTT